MLTILRQTKNWCFTVNNYDGHTMDKVVGYTYCVVGKEVGESGTPHLQGFIQMEKRVRRSGISKMLPTAWIDVMHGTALQAMMYCKKDGDYTECGEFRDTDPKGGASGGKAKAANYKAIIGLAESGQLAKLRDEHPSEYFRHYSTVQRMAMDNPVKPKDLESLDNWWFVGPPDSGKSYEARQQWPNLYDKALNKWWLGYKGELTVLLDDVDKQTCAWLGYFLKRWADHYSFPAETKGFGSQIRPNRIVVTSNYTIEQLWGCDPDLCAAITRRFKVKTFTIPIGIRPWDPSPPKRVIQRQNAATGCGLLAGVQAIYKPQLLDNRSVWSQSTETIVISDDEYSDVEDTVNEEIVEENWYNKFWREGKGYTRPQVVDDSEIEE